jgi:hypothetical protein
MISSYSLFSISTISIFTFAVTHIHYCYQSISSKVCKSRLGWGGESYNIFPINITPEIGYACQQYFLCFLEFTGLTHLNPSKGTSTSLFKIFNLKFHSLHYFIFNNLFFRFLCPISIFLIELVLI